VRWQAVLGVLAPPGGATGPDAVGCGAVGGSRKKEASGVRVVVDYDRCESNAICMSIVPEVFEVRDDDNLYVLQESPPESLRAKVEEAVRRCPKQAISLVED